MLIYLWMLLVLHDTWVKGNASVVLFRFEAWGRGGHRWQVLCRSAQTELCRESGTEVAGAFAVWSPGSTQNL